MLDTDLAKLYRVQTKALNQAIKRNIERFPDDFMIKLTKEEVCALRSQGVAMLSSVLRSKTAIMANI